MWDNLNRDVLKYLSRNFVEPVDYSSTRFVNKYWNECTPSIISLVKELKGKDLYLWEFLEVINKKIENYVLNIVDNHNRKNRKFFKSENTFNNYVTKNTNALLINHLLEPDGKLLIENTQTHFKDACHRNSWISLYYGKKSMLRNSIYYNVNDDTIHLSISSTGHNLRGKNEVFELQRGLQLKRVLYFHSQSVRGDRILLLPLKYFNKVFS